MMPQETELYLQLLAALCVGGLLGLERSYHARPAGFRTHALVCLSSALLMAATIDAADWLPQDRAGAVSIDPTRVVQGIMTGIGFLGAGTIIKEGLHVRGLTTAASIWATAAVGILFGVGMMQMAFITSALIFVTLSAFRWLEDRFPAQAHARLDLGFGLDAKIGEEALRRMLAGHGVSILSVSQALDRRTERQDFRMMIRSDHEAQIRELLSHLRTMPALVTMSIRRRMS